MPNLFFVGAVDDKWNNAGNWDLASGGPGGAGVPGPGDKVFFDGSSPDCQVDVAVNPKTLYIEASFSNTVHMNGFNCVTEAAYVFGGVLDLGGASLTTTSLFSNFEVGAGGTLRARGDETITAIGWTYNAASRVVLYDAAVVALLNNLGLVFGSLDLGPSGKRVNTTAGSTITIAGTLSGSGTFAAPVLVRSTVAGAQAFWILTGTSALGSGVDVADIDASGGATILAIGSLDGGNNVNWFFETEHLSAMANLDQMAQAGKGARNSLEIVDGRLSVKS